MNCCHTGSWPRHTHQPAHMKMSDRLPCNVRSGNGWPSNRRKVRSGNGSPTCGRRRVACCFALSSIDRVAPWEVVKRFNMATYHVFQSPGAARNAHALTRIEIELAPATPTPNRQIRRATRHTELVDAALVVFAT